MAPTDEPASTSSTASTPTPKKAAAKRATTKKATAKKVPARTAASRRQPSAAALERAREEERERTRIERAERLLALGLHPGDPVRFRRADQTRWKNATVERVESDGSIGLRDDKGAARSIPVELVEVKTTGKRGGTVWEPLPVRVAAAEQLRLI